MVTSIVLNIEKALFDCAGNARPLPMLRRKVKD